jgi:hypothetical protein
MKYIPKYQKAGKLPILPAYNYQMVQDNATMQRPIETDMMSKEEQIKRGHDLRVKEKQEALTKYRNQPGMISGMKQNPTQSDMKEYATQAVAYNNKLRNDPVGTLGPDVAMSILPELLLLKGPSQAIGKGLNYLNPFKFKLPKILKSTSTSKPLPVGDFTNLEDAERFLNRWSRIHINDDYMNNALISKYGPESSIENLNTLISANQMTELDAYNTAINAIRKQSNNFNG